MEKNCIWLSNSFLHWYAEMQCSSYTSVEDRLRAYKLWQHAELIAAGDANEFNRVDIVSNLKRCLNQRLKFIEHVYSLKKIASSDSPKGYLEYLRCSKTMAFLFTGIGTLKTTMKIMASV